MGWKIIWKKQILWEPLHKNTRKSSQDQAGVDMFTERPSPMSFLFSISVSPTFVFDLEVVVFCILITTFFDLTRPD